MIDEWWKTFLSGLMVDFWRAAMPEEATRAESDFLEKRLLLGPGARVLDVPCGAGRHAIELATRGYRVTGVDISSEFLEAAKASARERGLSIDWRHSEMRNLPWQSEFDAAYCAGSSFGFLGDRGDREFLAAVARVLRSGGRFFGDFKAAESILPNFRESYEMTLGDIRFAARNRYDPLTATMENVYTATRGDRSETKRAVHRIYTANEILRMFEEAGFSNFETFGSI
jgi:ubiquinone/menaquinone biosynthesis C-methylase UbiE